LAFRRTIGAAGTGSAGKTLRYIASVHRSLKREGFMECPEARIRSLVAPKKGTKKALRYVNKRKALFGVFTSNTGINL